MAPKSFDKNKPWADLFGNDTKVIGPESVHEDFDPFKFYNAFSKFANVAPSASESSKEWGGYLKYFECVGSLFVDVTEKRVEKAMGKGDEKILKTALLSYLNACQSLGYVRSSLGYRVDAKY